jgi:phosphatidylserine/phosphatidylglycerophosphate/cardiolipin synthase-like enzyme
VVDLLHDKFAWDSQPTAGTDKTPETRTVPALPRGSGEAASVELVTSPQALDGVAGMIRLARKHLELQHMDLPSEWAKPTKAMSPIVGEVIRAARKGVSVRVLLNDEGAFGFAPAVNDKGLTRNQVTVQLLNQIARCEKLDIGAAIIDVDAVGITYVHNKGALADDRWSFVSSINGTQNSVENNREVALLVDSPDAARYYGEAFDFDWENTPDSTLPLAACRSFNLFDLFEGAPTL